MTTKNFSLTGRVALEGKLRDLAREYPRDASRALNRTSQRIGTRTRRDIASQNKLPQKVIKNRVQPFKANWRNLQAWVWVGLARKILLSELPGAKFMLSGTLRAGKHSARPFRARMPSGKVGLYVRKAQSKHVWRDGVRTELPIEEPTIRIDKARARGSLLRHLNNQMATFFPDELRRLVTRTTKRIANKGARK